MRWIIIHYHLKATFKWERESKRSRWWLRVSLTGPAGGSRRRHDLNWQPYDHWWSDDAHPLIWHCMTDKGLRWRFYLHRISSVEQNRHVYRQTLGHVREKNVVGELKKFFFKWPHERMFIMKRVSKDVRETEQDMSGWTELWKERHGKEGKKGKW